MPLPAGDAQLVQIMDAALADAARRAGPWLVCREGCTPCCYGAFAINALDVERLRAGMETIRATDPSLARAIELRAKAWIREHSAAFPGDFVTGVIGDSAADRHAFEDFANDAACPALDPATGRCDVYAWRPMTCRVFGPPVRMGNGEALGCCELCFQGTTEAEIAACEMPVPHELEERLLANLGAGPESGQETVVAYALLNPQPSPAR
jgi:Fe-S-cluster containining protein